MRGLSRKVLEMSNFVLFSDPLYASTNSQMTVACLVQLWRSVPHI